MDRRRFLGVTGIGAAAFVAGGALIWHKARSSQAEISVGVPRLIFLPECRPSAMPPVSYCTGPELCVTGMETVNDAGTNGTGEIRLWFANGRSISVDKEASFASMTARANNRVSRDALLVKSFASWALDSLMNRFRNSREQTYSEDFLKGFHRLQAQDVLESVTPHSLFLLFKSLEGKKSLGRLAWRQKEARFSIHV